MNYQTLTVAERADAVWITLARPEQMNALDDVCVAELSRALASVDDAVAVVLTGSGPVFSAGADLKMARRMLSDGGEVAAFLRATGDLMCQIEALPIPTVAAVNGVALAGGLELMLACDIAIAAESAKLGDAHANFGLLPGAGGSQRLPRAVGFRRALQLLYTGALISAREALTWGLVNEVAPDGELEAAVDRFVATLATKSGRGLARMKSLARFALDASLEAGLALELDTVLEHMSGPDVREGLAAFSEKRSPRFRDL